MGNLSNLIEDVKRKPLVLFIGAGVMKDIIPLWDGLLQELLIKVIDYRFYDVFSSSERNVLKKNVEKSNSFTVYEKASIIKKCLGDKYLYFLKDVLYSKYNKNFQGDFNNNNLPNFFKQVSKLCKNQNVVSIVTYNYDDILTSSIKDNREVYCISGSMQENSIEHYYNKLQVKRDKLEIYYMHGYLPYNKNILDMQESPIVLSTDEYFQNMLEPFSWQTTTQLHFLRNFTCLFLGISLNDWNMMRIISYSKRYIKHNSVYILMCEESFFPNVSDLDLHDRFINIKNFRIRMKATLFEELGVKLIVSGDKFQTLEKTVQTINNRLS